MSEWEEGKPEEAYETVWAWDGENVTAAYVDCLGVWLRQMLRIGRK